MNQKIMHIENLNVFVEQKQIIYAVDCTFQQGKVYGIVGANGSGKSSLLYALFRHPAYRVEGTLMLDNIDLMSMPVDQRVRAGMFLAPQVSSIIPGVRVFDFIKEAVRIVRGADLSIDSIYDELCEYMDLLQLDHSFAYRSLHDGFSGGEKKRLELLQMLILHRSWVFLDEIDSGLDAQSRHLVNHAIKRARNNVPELTIVCISHYQETLDMLAPDNMYVMNKGILSGV